MSGAAMSRQSRSVTDNKETILDSHVAVTLCCQWCGEFLQVNEPVVRELGLYVNGNSWFYGDHFCISCFSTTGQDLTEVSRPCERCARPVFFRQSENHKRVLCSKSCESAFYRGRARRQTI